MDKKSLVEWLAQAGPHDGPGRYAVVEMAGDDEVDGEWLDSALVGAAASLGGALDLLAATVAGRIPDPVRFMEEFRPDGVAEDDYEQWLDDSVLDLAPTLRRIDGPARRMLAYLVLGYISGCFNVRDTAAWNDAYLADARRLFAGARFVVFIGAAPPHHDEAYAILEVQPAGEPTGPELALLAACRAGDRAAVGAALAAGARVDALDRDGMSALHVAVAHRWLPVVETLLTAGADRDLQAGYGNAAVFAALDRDGRVGSHATHIDDEGHWRILRTLLEAGAAADAVNRSGMTLLDLAIRTVPYPTAAVAHLVARQVPSAALAGVTPGELLQNRLPHRDEHDLLVRLNELRFLFESGADPNEPSGWLVKQPALHALLVNFAYHEHEVSGEALLALVDLLLAHGAADPPGRDGRTALDAVTARVGRGLANYRPVADRLRENAR